MRDSISFRHEAWEPSPCVGGYCHEEGWSGLVVVGLGEYRARLNATGGCCLGYTYENPCGCSDIHKSIKGVFSKVFIVLLLLLPLLDPVPR